ncbi:MAG: NIL domain-containing protein [Candidatus Omnitrophica bacterium]|nr:NIL domain-containing protein [Candidatus Omnitrophota bacterium]
MPKKSFHLYFPQKLIKEPLMYLAARDNNLLLNIRRAKITAEAGEATVELEGDLKNIEKAEKLLRDKGVKVESVLGDIVEG